MTFSSIHELLREQAVRAPEDPALIAPGRAPLSYGGLWKHVQAIARRLGELGIRRDDRVAVVLPNGPEMAATFLSVASVATCAPLNPACRAAELDYYLSDLVPVALIISPDLVPSIRDIAEARSISLLELTPERNCGAGVFELAGDGRLASPEPTRDGWSEAEDVALMLHTSGTTSRPKMVPLTHANLCTSAINVREVLRLKPEDRCLNIMPLFHIHGLVGATLSSLAAGGSVVCTPGYYAPDFFRWMAAQEPTWYTGVPTMHQGILARAGEHRDIMNGNPLRFIRSSSSRLSRKLMEALEETFEVPVIDSYGMSEAAHQIASNPLPPSVRKPGSVGLAFGPDVAIMREEDDSMLPRGTTGEIVVRGRNMTSGYTNPDANKRAFTADGWFRTGDLGYIDGDNYLFVTGRLKEIINRGGEKISPSEIDDVLMEHPEIVQAVTFSTPHPTLGEDVAAAVTLRSGSSSLGEAEIRRFVAERVADFKVPRRVVILDELPKSATGKPRRVGLAEELGLTHVPADRVVIDRELVPPRNDVERLLAEIWIETLDLKEVGVHDHFLDLGGDSITATRLVARIRQTLQLELTLLDFFDAPTVADQADIVEGRLLSETET